MIMTMLLEILLPVRIVHHDGTPVRLATKARPQTKHITPRIERVRGRPVIFSRLGIPRAIYISPHELPYHVSGPKSREGKKLTKYRHLNHLLPLSYPLPRTHPAL